MFLAISRKSIRDAWIAVCFKHERKIKGFLGISYLVFLKEVVYR